MLRRLLSALFGYGQSQPTAPKAAPAQVNQGTPTSIHAIAPPAPVLSLIASGTRVENGEAYYFQLEGVYVDKHGVDGFGRLQLGKGRLYFSGSGINLEIPWSKVQEFRLTGTDLTVIRLDRKNSFVFKHPSEQDAQRAHVTACALLAHEHGHREWGVVANDLYNAAGWGRQPSGQTFIGIVGESYRQDALRTLLKENRDRSFVAVLKCEPNNPHDANAVMVCSEDGDHLGYLERRMASEWCHFIASQKELRCDAELRGGTSDKPSIGVVLDFTEAKRLKRGD
jgi:hypothetical protein